MLWIFRTSFAIGPKCTIIGKAGRKIIPVLHEESLYKDAWRSGGIPRRYVVNCQFHILPFYFRGRINGSHLIGASVDPGAGLDAVTRGRSVPLPGIKSRSFSP
jgi:hypothetical protein